MKKNNTKKYKKERFKKIHLLLATMEDFDFFYEIKSNPKNMFWTGHKIPPNRKQLFNFFQKQLLIQNEFSKRKIFIIKLGENNNISAGYLYLDPVNEKTASVSVAILDKYVGMGIAKNSIGKLCDIASDIGFECITADIREDNIPSKEMFNSAGFRQTDKSTIKLIQSIGKEVRMVQYVRLL
jgi:RimJ/RimL family protein N-acetyltransferase